MDPFLQGVLVGLTFAVLLGPAFFSLIQTSIHVDSGQGHSWQLAFF